MFCGQKVAVSVRNEVHSLRSPAAAHIDLFIHLLQIYHHFIYRMAGLDLPLHKYHYSD